MELCKAVSKGEKVDINYTIQEEFLVWKRRIYVLKAMRKMVIESEHDSTIAGHFGRDRTMELICQNFFWPKMEDDVREYCN